MKMGMGSCAAFLKDHILNGMIARPKFLFARNHPKDPDLHWQPCLAFHWQLALHWTCIDSQPRPYACMVWVFNCPSYCACKGSASTSPTKAAEQLHHQKNQTREDERVQHGRGDGRS